MIRKDLKLFNIFAVVTSGTDLSLNLYILRPILYTVDLKNYQRYECEIFRIGRQWSEVVPIVFLRQWCHSLELTMAQNLYTNF